MRYKANDRIPVTVDPAGESRFWWKTFAVYAIVEAVFHIATYLIEYSQCPQCLLPPMFYITRYALNLLLALLLWYLLNRLYGQPLWKAVLGNILVFFLYYFIYAGYIYVAINSEIGWLVWPFIKNVAFEWVVYGSWFDIGKYVLKLSAFYSLRFYLNYRKAARQRLELAVMNKDMQLSLLKQQLNPHFYFNTLNNLYGLARSNSPKLVTALNQLENIMQYVIEDCNKPVVLLKQEIVFLESYIELEKLRYEQDTPITVNVKGDAASRVIVPMLLIQFVENAFKHGMKEKSEQNWMKVDLQVQDQELLFRVENSAIGSGSVPGIGMSSVRHLLQLQYEGKHALEWINDANRFSVNLKLNLV